MKFLYHRERLSEGVTQEGEGSGRMEEAVQAVSVGCSKMRIPGSVSCDGEGSTVPKSHKSHCQEKPLAMQARCPYRKPTQVGAWRTRRRAGELSLRNSAKWPRNFGRRGALRRAAVKRPKRLFSKNTGLCEAERRSIGADACPVLEG